MMYAMKSIMMIVLLSGLVTASQKADSPSADPNNAPKAANGQWKDIESEADFLRMFGGTSPTWAEKRLDRQKKIAAALEEQKDDLDDFNEEDFPKQTEIKVAVDHISTCRCGSCYSKSAVNYHLEPHKLKTEEKADIRLSQKADSPSADSARNKNNMKRLEKAEALAGKRSWKCTACTFENFKMEAPVCEQCRSLRSGGR